MRMNKERYNQIIDEAYKNYVNKTNEDFIKSDITLPPSYYPMDKEEFINKCKTDSEFSQKWGLKIEERELSLLERYELMKKLDNWVSVHYKEPKTMEYMDKHNIPTKLITVTYNDKTIESYEINGKLCYCGNPVDTSNPDCVTFNLCKEHQMDV